MVGGGVIERGGGGGRQTFKSKNRPSHQEIVPSKQFWLKHNIDSPRDGQSLKTLQLSQ